MAWIPADSFTCSIELEAKQLHDSFRRALDSGLLLVRKVDSYMCLIELEANLYMTTSVNG